MARPKKEETTDNVDLDKASIRKKILTELNKKHGSGTIATYANWDSSDTISCISSGSIDLDKALGRGGYPRGRIIEIWGEESSGKSSLALHAVAECQKVGGTVAYLDLENAIDPEYAKKLGVDMNAVDFSQPDHGEQAFDIIESLLKSNVYDFIVVDSVAAMVPQKELEGEMGSSQMGSQARLMSQGLRKIAGPANRSKCVVFFINQVRCVSADELVITEAGIQTALEATHNKLISGYTGNLTPIGAFAHSSQEALKITTKSGRSVTCGFRHPILSIDSNSRLQWKSADSLKLGDFIAQPKKVELPELPDAPLPIIERASTRELDLKLPTHATEEFCRFLGMWYADGSMIHSGADRLVSFTENNEERRNVLTTLATSLGLEPRVNGIMVYFRQQVYRLLEAIGCEKGGGNKTIPSVITGKRQWRAFLNGMFDTHMNYSGLIITSENQSAGRKMQLALLGFGIQSKAFTVKKSLHIAVTGQDAILYEREIGFSEPSKHQKLLEEVGTPDPSARGKADIIPTTAALINNFRAHKLYNSAPTAVKQRMSSLLCIGGNLSRRDYLYWCELTQQTPELADFCWTKVADIEILPEMSMVDFDVPNGESFVAGGLVTHNTKIGVLYGDPSTTTGGNALKFYASIRMKITKGKPILNGDVVIGNETKVKVVKNKLAPPFRTANFRMLHGVGIDKIGELLDFAVAHNIVEKSGGSHSFNGEALGRSREKSLAFLKENPGLTAQLSSLVQSSLNNGAPQSIAPAEVEIDDDGVTVEDNDEE